MPVDFTDKIQFNGQVDGCDVAYDIGKDKYVFAYIPDDGTAYDGHVCVRVGIRTDNELEFGDIIQVSSTTKSSVAIIYNSDTGKVIVRGNNYVWVGTVSGSTVSFGSVTYSPIEGKFVSFDSKVALVVTVYNNPAKIVIGEISGTSITWGTAVEFGIDVYNVGPCYDSVNERIVICYDEDNPTPDEARAVVCSVSGVVPTVGTPVLQFASSLSGADAKSSCYDVSSGKIICVSLLDATPDVLVAISGTVSGMTISFDESPTVVVNTNFVASLDSVYNPASESCNFVYRNWDNNYIELLDVSPGDDAVDINGVYTMYPLATVYSSTMCDYDTARDSVVTVVNHESENSADAILSIYTPDPFWKNNQGHIEV